MSGPFRIDSHMAPDGHLIIRIAGRLTMGDTAALRSVMDRVVEEKIPVIYVEGMEMSDISSQAIGLLVGTRMKMDGFGGKILLVGLSSRIVQILKMAGVESSLPMHNTLEEAIEAASLSG
jgi:anti-anti-sigma factor